MIARSNSATPVTPRRELPENDWEHFRLYKDVRETIACLPIYFRTETHISGIMATDLHTLNTVLGATIEEQVVRTLNLTRNTWDPDEKYALYSFVRQAQTFPDVLLRKTSSGEILLGIELKGWYLLAKEAEPSLRFQTTAAACAKQDLIVVVPWVLGKSGSPNLTIYRIGKFCCGISQLFGNISEKPDSTRTLSFLELNRIRASRMILDKPACNFGRLAVRGLWTRI